MHDPMTVAFEIKSPFFHRLNGRRYHNSLITIWHVDPEKDGTDDSCGRFMRSRHGNKKTLDAIASRFEFDWDKYATSWFWPNGEPRQTPIGITLSMIVQAAWEHFKHSRRKANRFVKRHLHDIIIFAENPTDSLHSSINQVYGISERETREDRIRNFASICYAWVLRHDRPWYRHPRWHLHHWKIQIHFTQTLKRWLFSRCCKCGRRFRWGESPITNQWHGTGPRWFRGERDIFHADCGGGDVAAKAR